MEGLDKLPDSSTSSAQHKGRSASLSASIKGVLSKPRKEFRNDTYIHPNPSGSSMSGPSSLSDSRSHKEEDVETAHDEINRKSATSLQRAITTTSSNSGTSRDFKNASSLRVVGRGGQGSRPRQTKGEASGDNHDAWEPSHPTSAQGIDDHFTNARVTQSSTSKDGVRVVGRGGYGSKHRTPSLPSQPLTSVPQSPAITPKTPQSTSSAQQIRPIRLGGRGGAGSRPRASSLADSSSHPDLHIQFLELLIPNHYHPAIPVRQHPHKPHHHQLSRLHHSRSMMQERHPPHPLALYHPDTITAH
ncbi:hypothetical protein K435DRAFT_517581 [Dendrothele bispora CBS 962.96]|uniref:Uncharacterized protein n=1 Tax=Dendrothele bispora (strain CBS 962.96) TaxID=1314807 RepID=A0A4S8M946_DENBC|nr:hypothetical protein K435DRAFT_517581 [Dendrothele bispora CBS 962.96]